MGEHCIGQVFFAFNLQKITPGRKKLHRHLLWRLWQISGMLKRLNGENFGVLVFFSARTDCSIHKILDFSEVEFLGLRGPLAVSLSARPPLWARWGLGVPQHSPFPRQNVQVHILSPDKMSQYTFCPKTMLGHIRWFFYWFCHQKLRMAKTLPKK